MAERLVTVATFDTEPVAHLAKIRLEEEGIPCVVADAIANMLVSFVSPGVRLQVRESDASRAIEILETAGPDAEEEPEEET